MTQWLQSLSPLEYAMLLLAVPATLLLVLQTLLLLFSGHVDGGDGDGDFDTDGDFDADGDLDADFDVDTDFDADAGLDVDGDLDGGGDFDSDAGPNPDDGFSGGPGHEALTPGLFSGLKVLTLRGVVAFLAIFGWGTLWLLRLGLFPLAALFLGSAMGVWAMVLVALLLRVSLRLQDDGTLHIQNALGLSGSVYLTVPAQRQGPGKVQLLLQERFTEFPAVTDDPEALPTGTEVLIVGLSGRDTLVVTKK